jgi:hypothetical protein
MKEFKMKNSHTGFIILGIILLFQWNCNKSAVDDDPGDVDSIPAFVGFWQFGIAKVLDITSDSIYVNFDINADSTYTLDVEQADGKMLMTHHGQWEAGEDSITLSGSDCMVLDTATGNLVTLDDSICSLPIKVQQPPETGQWIVKMSDMAVLIRAFPVNATYTAFLSAMTIKFNKIAE